jgi:predicted nucleotidyltransferase
MVPMSKPDRISRERLSRSVAEGVKALPDRSSASVLAIFLYGSALEPTFRTDSDLDIAVLDRADSRLAWKEQARLMDHLERATGRNVDLRMLRDCSLSLQVEVLNRGVSLWIADEEEVARYRHEALSSWERQPHPDQAAWSSALRRLAALSISDS